MHTLIYILTATFIVGLLGLIGAFSLLIRKRSLEKIVLILVAFAAGALLSGGFFHLLAEALETLTPITAFAYLLIGFVVFFALEKILFWHHCHKGRCRVHPFSYLILLGDSLHNIIDGLVIAASFMVSIKFGTLTTLLVISHEIPQELGNFGILLHGGFSRIKAIILNFLAQLTCIVGGVAGYIISSSNRFTVYLLPIAAGGFIYIAASDLIPELHNQKEFKKTLLTFIFFVIGLSFMIVTKFLLS